MKQQLLGGSKSGSPGCCTKCCNACCCGGCCKPLCLQVWLVICVVSVIFWFGSEYQNKRWEAAWVDGLAKRTQIADTKLGKIEYYMKGSAPYVFFVHGQMGGWDVCGVPIVVDPWLNAGWGLICPSRPGYLRTPLPKYPFSTEEQSDLFAALLDTLKVDKVVVTGGSAGGPSVYQFAARYPERVIALIPLVAVSDAKPELPGTPMAGVDKEGNFPISVRAFSSFMTDATVGRLIAWSMQDVKASMTSGMMQMSRLSNEQQEAELTRVEANETLMDSAKAILLTTAIPFAPRWPGNENDIYASTFLKLNLENISVPTLIIHDEYAGSNGVPLKYALLAKKQIPNAELYIVKGAWHIVWLAADWTNAINKQIDFARAACGQECLPK